MVTGLPGAGIGGLFYLGNALLLPVRALVRAVRGGAGRWPAALEQAAIAAAMLAVIWLAGVAIGLWAGPVFRAVAPGTDGAAGTTNLLASVTLAVSLVTLALVLVSVQVARLVVRRPPSTRRPG